MRYTIKAHPTMYNGVQYRSRLEARWAAFFDCIGWKHEYEPIDLPGWTPDFRVVFPCGHSECNGSHSLLVEVKPYFNLQDFKGHPCLLYPYGQRIHGHLDSVDIDVWEGKTAYEIPADASAAFGANPDVTYWEMSHGAGGGVCSIRDFYYKKFYSLDMAWSVAGNKVQWQRGAR